MTNFDRKLLDTAFLKPGTPMIASVMSDIIGDETISATRKRDLLSGLRRISKALNRTPNDIPADPKWLQPRLAKIVPASLKVSQKTWANAVSDAKAALAHVGIVKSRNSHIRDLSPKWACLWRTVLDLKDPTLPAALCRFVQFLSRLGVAPEAVSDVHATDYLEAVRLNEISKSPDVAYRTAVDGWNLAVRRVPGWPQTKLILNSRVERFSLRLDAFPKQFADDLNRFTDGLARPDPLSDIGNVRPLRDSTISQYRRQLVRFASEVVHSGVSADRIVSLAFLVDPVMAEQGLRHMLKRKDNAPNHFISETSDLLSTVARRHVRVSDQDQRHLDKMAKRLSSKPQIGMTAKNRTKLRALEYPENRRRLINLPDVLMDRRGGPDYSSALAREDALAIAILLNCPIRRQNLVSINVDTNLQRPGDGRIFLVFEAAETKNRRRVEFELPSHVVRLIDTHLSTRSPILCPAATPWLFPKRDGKVAMNACQIAARVKSRIRKEIGIDMNVHLFRHFAAMLFLEAHPGAYEAARRLLGHKELSQTINAYAGFEAGTATRLFSDLLENARSA